MPVVFDSSSRGSRSGNSIRVGLINNMPDEALKATERQYLSLLNAASPSMQIHLSLYTLPGVPRSESSARYSARCYSNLDDMWQTQLDGLIVTGREPLAANLAEEPYWQSFTRTLAWAQENAYSTVWSCLAAHAAVLHMDGIRRVKRSTKLFGVFECPRVTDHPLTAQTSAHFQLPHSRWNGLEEDRLTACGYSVLTRTTEREVDTFIKQQKSLFVFFQGHPEYDSDTLLREYRRDIGRYLKGDLPQYPSMPLGYFDHETVAVLNALRHRTLSGEGAEIPADIAATLNNICIENTWQSNATRIYANWLRYIREAKEKAVRPRRTNEMVNAAQLRAADAMIRLAGDAAE